MRAYNSINVQFTLDKRCKKIYNVKEVSYIGLYNFEYEGVYLSER